MRKLKVFSFVSLDGCYTDRSGSMTWAHDYSRDEEFTEFATENARGSQGELLFGRVTYEMMASYWPTEMAKTNSPVTAEAMNRMKKHVLSRSPRSLTWNNSHQLRGELIDAVRGLKQQPGPDMMIFGSGSIVKQIATYNLVDEYQLIVVPLVLGGGHNMFEGIQQNLAVRLNHHRVFSNGVVLLSYSRDVRSVC